GFLADCVRALRGQTPSLAANRTFARSRAKLPGTRMVEVFVNAQQFGAALAPVLPYEIDALGRAFGVSGAPDLFLGFSHDGRSAHDLVALALPGPTDGLLKAPFSRPVTNQAAQWVKRDTTLFAAFSVDGAAAVEAGKRLLAALPEQARRELGREFERDFGREVRRELGMSPQQLVELLAAFGPEVAIAVDPPQVAPPFLTVSAFIQVRDPQRAEAAVRQLLARDARQAVQFEESDGIKTWSTELRVEGARVTPTVGLREGWLVFSN